MGKSSLLPLFFYFHMISLLRITIYTRNIITLHPQYHLITDTQNIRYFPKIYHIVIFFQNEKIYLDTKK